MRRALQRSVRFGPLKLNITGKGLSWVSVGRRGAWLTYGLDGSRRTTIGAPGTGLRWTEYRPPQKQQVGTQAAPSSSGPVFLDSFVRLMTGVVLFGIALYFFSFLFS